MVGVCYSIFCTFLYFVLQKRKKQWQWALPKQGGPSQPRRQPEENRVGWGPWGKRAVPSRNLCLWEGAGRLKAGEAAGAVSRGTEGQGRGASHAQGDSQPSHSRSAVSLGSLAEETGPQVEPAS